MIGVSQANRLLHFLAIVKQRGGREVHRTRTMATYTNPFGKTPDAAPYLFITPKAVVKFGYTAVGASAVTEQRMDQIMRGEI